MNDSKDLDEAIAPKFLSTCFEKIVALTQIANSFPEKDELGFYRRIPSCNQNIKTISSLIGETMKILSDFGTDNHRVETQKTIKYSDVVDVLDTYLENVDLTLDKIKDHTNQDKSLFVKERPNQSISDNSNEDKPQLRFKDQVDNSDAYPFIPKIMKKFNSDLPLNEKILIAQHNKIAFFQNIQNPPEYEFVQPYEEELNILEYQDFQFELDVRSQQPVPFKPHTFMYVDNQTEFGTLLEELRNQGIKEIAVDLEHHSYRSFQGFTCLMQISTREKDYIIDTLSLRDSMQELNEIFTNPKIVKVLHGADMDIEWLQKDFGIYVVNMFDTGQASKFLQFPSSGLAYLLKEFCNVTANKEYQTADWRKRPLPKEMIKYAREDTHYLLYIYDELRKKIIAKSGETNSNPIESLKSILNKSRVICAKSYRKPKLKSDHYYDILNRNKPILTNKKFQLLKAIYKWRDQTARTEDESTGFILPMNFVFEIMELNPKTPNEVYSRIRRMNWPAKKHINELLEAIKAVNEGATEAKAQEGMALEKIPSPVQVSNIQTRAFRPSFIDMELAKSEKFKIADENVGISFQKSESQRGHGSAHDYHLVFSSVKPVVTKDKEKHENIKKSFNYGSFYDFTMSFNPNFKKDILVLQKEHEKAAREKRQQIAEKEQQINQANLENTEGFMEFSKEKGPAPSKKEAPSFSLGLDKETSQKDNVLPPSLKEQYNVQANKKQRNRNRNKNKNQNQNDQNAEQFNEKVKKIKTNIEQAMTAHKLENKYELLVNDSSDEDEKLDGKALSKANTKAFNKFWEKNSRLDLEDPVQALLRKEGGKPPQTGKKKKFVNFKKSYSRKGVQK